MKLLNIILLLCSICTTYCSVYIYKQLKGLFYIPKRKEPLIKKSSKTRGPASILEIVPTDKDGVFTYLNYLAARKSCGLTTDGADKTITKWKERGYIEYLDNKSFRKLRKKDIRIIY